MSRTLPAVSVCLAMAVVPAAAPAQDEPGRTSVAGEWIEVTLQAIRGDFARPPVHARNLHHVTAAMYDAWAAFDSSARFVFLGADRPECRFNDEDRARNAARPDAVSARERAVAAAARGLLSARFIDSPGAAVSQAAFDELGERHAADDVADDGAASDLGRRVAACVLAATRDDGANEAGNYANRNYASVNPPLDPQQSGNLNLADPDRWQPLVFDDFIDQSGNRAEATTFIGAEWSAVRPFAMPASARSSVMLDGDTRTLWLDPGPQPRSDDADAGAQWADHHALVVQWSAHLDPRDDAMLDISPASLGASADIAALAEATSDAQLAAYDGLQGGVPAAGLERNPDTGQPYAQNPVLRGDWTRVIAEYWADGPDSETPPGHWFRLYRENVASHPRLQRRVGGEGEPLDPLAFDVLAHLALGGAMHDAAIAAWSVKGAYDSARPISAVRWMASLGQRSDTTAANYHPDGLPLVPGRIESIQSGDPLAGSLDRNVGRLKGFVWRGPTFVRDADTDLAGVGWVLLENWWPYQRANFVTPPFAGYVSGHSTFSRAAATVLERLTGDAYFPGGLASFTARADDFLVFERGPSTDIQLQWATYKDAANESGLSRIWGGIHPPADDPPGRAIGEQVGNLAWERAAALQAGEADPLQPSGGASSSGGGCSIDGSSTQGLWALLLLALGGLARQSSSARMRSRFSISSLKASSICCNTDPTST